MRLCPLNLCLAAALAGACGRTPLPTAPSAPTIIPTSTISLEAEAGSGEGDLMQRSRASGAQTIHLAPGQRRSWPFTVQGDSARFEVLVTYSNDNPGETEVLRVQVDGEAVGSIRAQDTGDDGEGWNFFVADLAGTSMLRAGAHVVTVESTGGDGCIEIDMIMVRRSP